MLIRVPRGMRSLLLLVAACCCGRSLAVVTFGTGNAGSVCVGSPVQLFNHTVSSAVKRGVMSHFWTTGRFAL